jgi:DNA-binding MarR family transcriptional regulator
MTAKRNFHDFAISGTQALECNAAAPESRSVLRAIRKLGPCHPYQIAELLRLKPQTVSGRLNKLRGWGFIKGGGGRIGKRRDSGVPWELTDKGNGVLDGRI